VHIREIWKIAVQWLLEFKILIGAVLIVGALTVIFAFVAAREQPLTVAGADDGATGSVNAWQAVAPGRVQPANGETRISAPVVGVVSEVLVKTNDKVFAGEPLIRLQSEELRARLKSAQAQVAMRERERHDQKVSGKDADRRRAEDAVSDAGAGVFEASSALDAAAIALRTGSGNAGDLDATRAALAHAREQLKARTAALRAIESGGGLPTDTEASLDMSRADLAAARAALDNATIRAPVAGTVLQVNVKVGETVAPATTQPTLVIGDVSTLRVRAELDDRDVADIKVGQSVVVQSAAFPGRRFAGKVASVAPIVEPANLRGPRDVADVDVVEVLVDLTEAGPLLPGMKVDAYFRRNTLAQQ